MRREVMQRRFQTLGRKRHLLADIERRGLMIDAESEDPHKGRLLASGK